uniref:Ig-like domain-containing protein n=1 Tax=Anopheles minimus TaxID=112268 RepID=A0A182VUE8_9DIPT
VLLPNYDHVGTSLKIFDIAKSVTLGCNITQEGNFELSWAKDGKNVSEVESLKDRFKLLTAERKLIISRALETDAGQYTCSVPQLGVSKNFNVVGKHPVALVKSVTTANVVVKFESTEIGKTNIVEGERLTLHCIAFGTDPKISWIVGESARPGSILEHSESITLLGSVLYLIHGNLSNAPCLSYLPIVGNNTFNASTDHIVLEEDERGVENAKLIIDSITLNDYADYTCEARNNASDFTGKPAQVMITVRVRGKYAALYVFLGIIVEVVLLCAIILICEKRRNKTEIEESDTDQSPDQNKNGYHGNESELRQRK